MGLIQFQLGAFKDALGHLDAVLEVEPRHVEALMIRGDALQALRRFDDAASSFDRALAIRPDYAEACLGHGNSLHGLERFDDALLSYAKALSLKPDLAAIHFHQGNCLWDMHRLEEAVTSYDRALTLAPDYAEAHYNRGNVLHALDRLEDAVASYDKAQALKPDLYWLAGQAMYVRMLISDWPDFEARRDDLIARIGQGALATAPLQIQGVIDSAELQYAATRLFAETYAAGRAAPPPKFKRHDRIRIAYISSDFHNHPVSHLLAGIFEQHDRTKFEVFALSSGQAVEDSWRKRISQAVDHFIDISALSDEAVVALAHQHEIDIAIDLNGYTHKNRAGVFAGRAAPIQLSYLGYLGTLGVPYMDYLIADEVLVPQGGEVFYTEKIIRLPCYQANDDQQTASSTEFTRRGYGLPDSGFVFCCFNQTSKITPDVFAAWMRILAQVDNSVLWLYATQTSAIRNLKAEAEKRGIASERLVFCGRVPLEDHLARQSLADLFLDTFPYNAGATASNALRMGLPVLTCIGDAFAARMGASLLEVVGLPELIITTPETYADLAVALARHPDQVAAIKQKLLAALPACPLFNTQAATRSLENAYTAIYERHQNDQPPDHLTIT